MYLSPVIQSIVLLLACVLGIKVANAHLSCQNALKASLEEAQQSSIPRDQFEAHCQENRVQFCNTAINIFDHEAETMLLRSTVPVCCPQACTSQFYYEKSLLILLHTEPALFTPFYSQIDAEMQQQLKIKDRYDFQLKSCAVSVDTPLKETRARQFIAHGEKHAASLSVATSSTSPNSSNSSIQPNAVAEEMAAGDAEEDSNSALIIVLATSGAGLFLLLGIFLFLRGRKKRSPIYE